MQDTLELKGGKPCLAFREALRISLQCLATLVAFSVVLLRCSTGYHNDDPWDSVPHRPREALNNAPIIGILTVPVTFSRNASCFGTNATSTFSRMYQKFFESGGARVVPIRFDLPREELLKLAGSVNAIYFTPGMTELREMHSQYMESAQALFDFAVQKNSQGIYLPMFGTCMGFQTLSILAGGPEVLEYGRYKGVSGTLQKLEFTSYQSRFFSPSAVSSRVVDILHTKYIAPNFHYDGVDPATFEKNPGLANTYRVVTVNHDRDGNPFASTIEGKHMPIYATQWHPEDNMFAFPDPRVHFTPTEVVNHEYDAVLAAVRIALFLVDEARRNSQSFDSADDEFEALSLRSMSSNLGQSAWAPETSYCFGKVN